MEKAQKDIESNKHLLSSALETIHSLEHSKESVEKFIDEIPQLALIVMEGGRIIRGNRKAAQYFGLDMETLLDHNMFEILNQDNAD